MRCVFKILFVFLIFFSVVSFSQAAVIYGGKVYNGGNFTTSVGGTFLLYGLDSFTKYNNNTDNTELYYKGVIITSSLDDTVNMRNGTCYTTRKFKYCYKSSAIDMSNIRTFVGDYLQAGMSITIETLPQPSTLITVSRASVTKSYCGQLTTIPVTINNTGTFDTNVTYTENLPENVVIANTNGGNVIGRTIQFQGTVYDNGTRNFSFTINNLDCKSKNWTAFYIFNTYNDTIRKNITNLTILMQDSYTINESISPNKTNNPNDKVKYSWTIQNVNPISSLALDVFIDTSGLNVVDSSSALLKSESTYKYDGILSTGAKLTLYLSVNAPDYGSYTIINHGNIQIDSTPFPYSSNKTLQVVEPKAYAYLDINTSLNKSIYVSVFVKNDNVKEKYYYIYGNIKGISSEEPIYYNSINPDEKILVVRKQYNTSGLVFPLNISFDGIYRDKNSVEYKLHTEQYVLKTGVVLEGIVSSSAKTANASSSKNSTTTGNTKGASANSPATSSKTGNKDFITSVLEWINGFLQSLFG